MHRRFYNADHLRDMQELVRRAGVLFSDRIAYKELSEDRNILEYTYRRLEDDINAFGTKLLSMGMKGYHLAILGENSYAWVVSYLSVVNGVGVAIPMDKELTEEELAKLFIKSDTEAVIFSKTFFMNIKNILPLCPKIKTCIVMNPEEDEPDFFSMEKMIKEGKELIEKGDRNYLNVKIDRETMCEIVFTSGTTGANKGVMLSHKNIMTVVYGAIALCGPKGVSFSVLPINHTYECSCHILGAIYSGMTICFNDSLKRVVENMKLFKPNMSIMVPLFLESMYKNIWKEAGKNNLADHLRYGIWYSNLLRKIGIDLRRLFFKPVLVNFGGNLNQIVCGGAPLRSEIIKGLEDMGIEILNGYGITECSPLVSSNMSAWKKKDSVGRVMPGIQVRINDPDDKGKGEIQVKGDNVMLGYYEDPVNTQRSFTEDGWFKTGDLGTLDNDNFLYINGRAKNLIILSNGKNVHPEEIEDVITRKLTYVKEVVVYSPAFADGSEESIYAYVYLDQESIENSEIVDIQKKLDHDIELMNHTLPVYKRVAHIQISETEFEKTTTKKIKRTSIVERSKEHA